MYTECNLMSLKYSGLINKNSFKIVLYVSSLDVAKKKEDEIH